MYYRKQEEDLGEINMEKMWVNKAACYKKRC